MLQSGIYQIRNILTEGVYIGSTVNFNNRRQDHFYQLREGIHHCIHLQRSFNKHGENNYVFEILAICPVEYLKKLEQWFLDNRLEKKYNTLKFATSSLGFKHSENFKKWLSHRQKNMSDWTRVKIANSLYGRKASQETKDKMSKSNKGIPKSREVRLEQSKTTKGFLDTTLILVFELYNLGLPPREIGIILRNRRLKFSDIEVNSLLSNNKHVLLKEELGLIKKQSYKYASKNRK